MPSITMDLINHSLDLMMQKYNYFLNTKIFFPLNLDSELWTLNSEPWTLTLTYWLKDSKIQSFSATPRLCDSETQKLRNSATQWLKTKAVGWLVAELVEAPSFAFDRLRHRGIKNFKKNSESQ